MIKITTTNGKVVEGELFALDPVTKAVSIRSNQDTYVTINSYHITQITGNLSEAKAADFAKLGVQ
jgi:hypothetical protein